MRKLAVVGGLFVFAAIAWALPARFKYEMATCPAGVPSSLCIAAQVCSAGSCTGTAPVDQANSTEGMWLGGLQGYRLTACAASGQTLSGAGTLQAYAYSSAEAAWARGSYVDVSVNISGKRCQTWDFSAPNGFDRVRYVAAAVTVSGGATLDVLLEGQTLPK